MTLGSLFDGSGGFPLAGALCGIRPVWASEIEPYPLRVTAARFPEMKQLGDVTKIDGRKIEPVDIITFGSPCQDLSVAGKQAGIHEGARSSLFFEAIRIIREMRDGTAAQFPRFAVWENVPGAFSSNKGEDFRAVLQAFCNLWGGQDHIVPAPPRGKWLPAGCIVGDGASLAWRVYDAQFWGVPQRRKRIYLIADFRSERAGEILFKRESLPGDSEPGRETGEGAAGDAAGSAGRGDCAFGFYANAGADAGSIAYGRVAPTLRAEKVSHVCHLSFAWANSGEAGLSEGETAPTVKASRNGEPAICYGLKGNWIDRETKQNGSGWREEIGYTLDATDRHGVAYTVDCRNLCMNKEKSGTLQAKNEGGFSLNFVNPIVCLNDQGGAKMEVNEIAGTLRAQEHGHPPVVCMTAGETETEGRCQR